MPKDTRHYRKRKKPNRRTSTLENLSPTQLKIHRELQLLRIAGGARPGRHKDELLQKRIQKLNEADVAIFKEIQKESRKRTGAKEAGSCKSCTRDDTWRPL